MHERWAPYFAAFASLILGTLFAWGSEDFCLDDAWIHLSYAQSLHNAGDLSYNPGDHETGFSSPLWVFLLALLPHGTQIVAQVKLLGVLFHSAAAFCVCGIALELARPLASVKHPIPLLSIGLAAGLTSATHPLLLVSATSGMEVSLAAFVSACFVLAQLRGQIRLAQALAGLAPLARPELLIFIFAYAGIIAVVERNRTSLTYPLAALGTFAGWCAYNLGVSGSLLPNTFYVKSALSWRASLEYLQTTWASHEPWLVSLGGACLFVAGIWRVRKHRQHRLWPLLIAWLAFTLIIAFSRPLHRGILFFELRYFTPLAWIPGTILALGLASLRPRYALPCLLLFGAASSWLALENWQRQRNQEHNTATLHTKVAQRIARELPADAVIAVEGAGATRYFAQTSQTIVDLLGLNHHAIAHAPSDTQRLCAALATQPQYFLLPDPLLAPLQRVLLFEPVWVAFEPAYAQSESTFPLRVHLLKLKSVARGLQIKCGDTLATPPQSPSPSRQ